MSKGTLQPVQERGWLTGFGNLLRRENASWWRTRTWWVHAIIWLAIINGVLAALLWTVPSGPEGGTAQQQLPAEQRVPEAVEVFMIIGGMATAVGVSIVAQGAIIDERQSGTLEWILSKPVSRTAVLLAKLIALGVGALAIMVALQGLVAYLQMMLAGHAPTALPFIGGLGLVGLNLVFYLALTLMLGVLFSNRGPVIGIPLGLIFGYQIILGLAPWLAQITPYGLVVPTGPDNTGMAALLAQGGTPPSTLPIFATMLWIILFVGVAVWRFERLEF